MACSHVAALIRVLSIQRQSRMKACGMMMEKVAFHTGFPTYLTLLSVFELLVIFLIQPSIPSHSSKR